MIDKSVDIKEIMPGLYLAEFADQFWMASCLMRIQEFYESPSIKIRNNHFSIETLMDFIASNEGNFTYTTDFTGFNVPSSYLKKFYRIFNSQKDDLWEKERWFFDLISEKIPNWRRKKFYFIASVDGDIQTKHHEICHGFYYLIPSFKRSSKEIFRQLAPSHKKWIYRSLKEWGYSIHQKTDEGIAYLSTSPYKEIRNSFGNINYGIVKLLKQNFKKFFKEYIGD